MTNLRQLLVIVLVAVGCGGSLAPGADGGGQGGSLTTSGTATSTGTGISGAGGSAGSGGSGGGDRFACRGPGTCVAIQAACCGVCGQPELPDVVGINRDHSKTYRQEKCAATMGCPLCLSEPNPSLGARCEANRCEPFDVRQEPEYSGCMSEDDCELRAGVACCACNAESNAWIAVSHGGARALSMVGCNPETPCPPCGPPIPPRAFSAVCANNVCQLVVQL